MSTAAICGIYVASLSLSLSLSLQSSMHFMTGTTKDRLLGNKLSHATRLPTTDPIAISKIYPTPPSVETSDRRYEEQELMDDTQSTSFWDREVSCLSLSLSDR